MMGGFVSQFSNSEGDTFSVLDTATILSRPILAILPVSHLRTVLLFTPTRFPRPSWVNPFALIIATPSCRLCNKNTKNEKKVSQMVKMLLTKKLNVIVKVS